MIQLPGNLTFRLTRLYERLLPVELFCRLFLGLAGIRAWNHHLIKGPADSLAYPECLRFAGPTSPPRLERQTLYLTRVLEMIPDRLPLPDWRARCEIAGLDPIRKALAARQPVVLAFAHFGGYRLLRSWLRATGIPTALLVAEPRTRRSRVLKAQDRLAAMPEVPVTFDGRSLAGAIRFLQAGHCLGTAIDVSAGRHVRVPLDAGWHFRLTTGAIRLARRTSALLIPASVVVQPGCRFKIELGEPTPREMLDADDDLPAARHLVDQFVPIWTSNPDQWTESLHQCFESPARQPGHHALHPAHDEAAQPA